MLASLISRDFLFQLTLAENADVVANCDHFRNLTAPPKPGRRPIATSLSYGAGFADACAVASIVSILSRHLRWNHFVNLQQILKDGNTAAEYWTDLPRKAVLCTDTKTRDLCARTLAQRKLPVANRISTGHFDPTSNKVKVMTIKVREVLEFPGVTLPGVGHVPAPGRMKRKQCRFFYVTQQRLRSC